jgi:hypothetical protein
LPGAGQIGIALVFGDSNRHLRRRKLRLLVGKGSRLGKRALFLGGLPLPLEGFELLDG